MALAPALGADRRIDADATVAEANGEIARDEAEPDLDPVRLRMAANVEQGLVCDPRRFGGGRRVERPCIALTLYVDIDSGPKPCRAARSRSTVSIALSPPGRRKAWTRPRPSSTTRSA